MVADKVRDYHDERAKERQKEHGGTAPGKNTGGKPSTSDSGKARDAAGKAAACGLDGFAALWQNDGGG
jgi:hypothetical protein